MCYLISLESFARQLKLKIFLSIRKNINQRKISFTSLYFVTVIFFESAREDFGPPVILKKRLATDVFVAVIASSLHWETCAGMLADSGINMEHVGNVRKEHAFDQVALEQYLKNKLLGFPQNDGPFTVLQYK